MHAKAKPEARDKVTEGDCLQCACTVSMHENACVSVLYLYPCEHQFQAWISRRIIFRHNELSCGLYLTAWAKSSAVRAQALVVCT